jgi:hypothetical protein
MPDQAKSVARPWRRFLRFSIRGLIVLLLVIGAGLGWLVRSARIQREAVAAVTKAGGRVSYDWEWSNWNAVPGGKPWAPRWLTELIGVDYFGNVTAVWLFSPSTATDAAIVQVGRLTRLQLLSLDQLSLGDASLTHLTGLTNLSYLGIGGAQFTDAGLAHLKGLTNLSVLVLRGTQVTDAGLAHLNGLTKLSVLYLDLPHVTDAGLVYLKALTKLSHLHLSGTQVTNAGMKELKQALPRLLIYR